MGMAFEEGNSLPQTPHAANPTAFSGGSKRMTLALRQLARSAPKKDRAQFERIMAQTEPIMEYLGRQEQIEAASTALEASREQHPEINIAGKLTEPEAESFGKMISQVTREMAQSIFTPERLQGLIARLKQYRDERFAASDHAAVRAALGAIVSLERKGSPADNRFLNLMCFQALRDFTTGSGPKASAD